MLPRSPFATAVRCYVQTSSTVSFSTKTLYAELNREVSFSIVCSYGHCWSPTAKFLRTSCKQEPTWHTETSSRYSDFQSDSLHIFNNISFCRSSKKFVRSLILSFLSTFLCQSPKYIYVHTHIYTHIYIYIYTHTHVNMEFLYCGMLSCHGKILQQETINLS